jgi:hypothetical protein
MGALNTKNSSKPLPLIDFEQIKSMNLNAKSMDERDFEPIFWFKVI